MTIRKGHSIILLGTGGVPNLDIVIRRGKRMNVYKIVTHTIIDVNTGEVTTKDFKEVKERKKMKCGFNMTYNDFFTALGGVVHSNKDYVIAMHIINKFTYKRIEVVLSKVDIAKELDVTDRNVSRVIKRMVDSNILARVSRGIYRLNPFMYLPYKANGEELQREWLELFK